MYTIAFYSTVFLFAASLYICDKIADSVNNHKHSNNTADYHIGQSTNKDINNGIYTPSRA